MVKKVVDAGRKKQAETGFVGPMLPVATDYKWVPMIPKNVNRNLVRQISRIAYLVCNLCYTLFLEPLGLFV